MTPKHWLIFIVAFLVLAFMLLLGDFLLAGLLFLVVVLFDASVAGIVFKWVVISLLFLELPVVALYLHRSIKDERNEM